MKVVLHDRTDILGPDVREYAQRKLTRLAHHFGKVAEADVEFSPERKRNGLTTVLCRILVHVDGRRTPLLSAHESGADPQAAFDLAFDKIDRQVLKLKGKMIDRHRSGAGESEPQAAPATVTEGPERVITRVKAESVSQAMDALEANGYLFHLFLDEDTGDLNLIYRRGDGSVAIIEPRID